MASRDWKGLKSGSLNLLEPSETVKAFNGIALPLTSSPSFVDAVPNIYRGTQ
jgi:hypothetical protein